MSLSSDVPPPGPGGARQKLAGLVERVVFHSEDTGYCVLKVLPDGAREGVSLIGKAPSVVAGEHFQAEGVWEQNRDFGRQFKADTLQLQRPDSLDGMERYLASGLIEGIGPAYARRLIERFGVHIFHVIENESVRLEEVEGIGRKRRQEIRESWMRQKAVHGIMLFLHAHGISSSRALRIYKTYGEAAVEVLRASPYRLAADIRGVGFKTADQIAQQMGVEKDAPERLRAGLLFALESAAESGHCCLPEKRLQEQAAEMLGVNAAFVEEQSQHLVAAGELELHLVEGVPMVYLPHLRAAEVSIATHLQALRGTVAGAAEGEALDAAVAAAERAAGKQLAPTQAEAVREALRQRLLIITGGPGVGKTTILRTLLAVPEMQMLKVVLAAPTGRAAKRLSESTGQEARTLHRLLEYQGDGTWGRNRSRPLVGDLFIVDESSMIDAPLMAQFTSALPAEARLILVGDVDQLPSVGPGRVLGDLIASGNVPCVHLTEIFRQAASSRIVTNAHEINRGRVPDLKPVREDDFFFLERREPEAIQDTIVELVRDRLPRKYGFDPAADIQVLTPMNRQSLGTKVLNGLLQSALNPANELKYEVERFGTCFRAGDKVIQTHNNYDKDVFNGDIGFITGIETEPLKVRVRFEGARVVEYEPGELDELQLAYALSIHKSQGSEFPCVVIPMSTQHYVMLERSLIYTAITRARKLVVLVGDPRALELAVQRQENRRRFTGLRSLAGNVRG